MFIIIPSQIYLLSRIFLLHHYSEIAIFRIERFYYIYIANTALFFFFLYYWIAYFIWFLVSIYRLRLSSVCVFFSPSLCISCSDLSGFLPPTLAILCYSILVFQLPLVHCSIQLLTDDWNYDLFDFFVDSC